MARRCVGLVPEMHRRPFVDVAHPEVVGVAEHDPLPRKVQVEGLHARE